MTKSNLIPSILNVKSVELDVSEDLNSAQTKSIAECLYENNNQQQDLEYSENPEKQKNNEEKEQQ